MFNFFKKKQQVVEGKNFEIKAPIDGVCVAMEDVPDEVFSEKMMGDGIAINPTSDTLCAPISGTISALFDTQHAFGITGDNGVEVLVHCGLETVNLGGKGFTVLKNTNERVEAGDPIIKVDRAFMEENNIPLITPVVILNQADMEIAKRYIGQTVQAKESTILELK